MAEIEGAIRIVKLREQKFRATFERYTGDTDAGAAPYREFDDLEALDAFLRKIGAFDAKRLRALVELQKSQGVTVGFVRLSPERLKALRLIE